MLSRRSLLLSAVSAAPVFAFGNSKARIAFKKMITPPRLKPGDLVAIVAPAGACRSEEILIAAKANVESLGLRAKIMPNCGKTWGYLAGTDEERANDLNEAVQDSNIKGIIALRGGYGTMRILPLLDYDAMRKNPKILMGYSDITGLLNAYVRKSGVVTYHGPIAEAKFLGFEGEQARRVLFEEGPIGKLPNPAQLRGKTVFPAARTIQPGKAKGRLIGGNLSLISPCAGTPYGPDFDGAILFLEDTNEDPYRVDRMLTGLWLGGHLRKIKGIVFGDFRPPQAEATASENSQPTAPDFSQDQVFDNLRMWTNIPIFCGLFAGHIADKLTLPIGAMVEMDAEAQTLTVL